MKHEPVSYQIYGAPAEDMNEGWIWIRHEAIKSEIKNRRRIVKFKNTSAHSRPVIYCEALYAEQLEINRFNKSRNNPLRNDCFTLMSGWYRHRLGIPNLTNNTVVKLELTTNAKPWWLLFACLQHPQIVIVLATVLGIIGLGLGLIGVGLGLIAIKELDAFGLYGGIAFLLAGICVVIGGVIPLLKRTAVSGSYQHEEAH